MSADVELQNVSLGNDYREITHTSQGEGNHNPASGGTASGPKTIRESGSEGGQEKYDGPAEILPSFFKRNRIDRRIGKR